MADFGFLVRRRAIGRVRGEQLFHCLRIFGAPGGDVPIDPGPDLVPIHDAILPTFCRCLAATYRAAEERCNTAGLEGSNGLRKVTGAVSSAVTDAVSIVRRLLTSCQRTA